MINDVKNETFYSPEELANKFQMSLSSIYKMIRSGGLPHIRLGKVYRIPASDLQHYLTTRSKDVTLQKPPVIPGVATLFINEAKKSSSSKNIFEVWLFGSYARGDYDVNSDVDLLIILKEKTIASSHLITEFCEKAMEALNYEDLLSPVEISKEEWNLMQKNKYLLAQTIETEGILLWKNH